MSLKLKLCVSISTDCSKISFYNKTLVYDGAVNTGGYNDASTEQVSQITSSTVDVLLPNTTVPVTINLGTTLNTIDGTIHLDKLPTDLGVTSFPEGLYTFTFVQVFTHVDTTVYTYQYVTSQVFCCGTANKITALYKKIALNTDDCSCKCGSDTKALEIMLYETGLNAAALCNDQDGITKILKRLNRLLSNCGCKTCNK